MNKGNTFVEVIFALGLATLIGVNVMDAFPQILRRTLTIGEELQLTGLARYVGSYLYRWADISASAKPQSFDSFNDSDELDSEHRINRLSFAEPLIEPFVSADEALGDEFKTTMTFFETNRVDRAVIKVVIWKDDNLDDVVDATESQFTFSTVVSEKQ